MPITLNCTCGKTLRVADEYAGRRAKCPVCNAVVATPAPQPAFEVVEEPMHALTRPAAKAPAASSDDDDDRGYGMAKAEAHRNPPKQKPNFRKRAEDEDDLPVRGKKKGRKFAAETFAIKRIGYVIGGVAMIAAGFGLAIWGNSGAGRGATKLMIFGICLVVGGLITLVRGITGNIPEAE